jgi:hypothetical protein
VVIYKDTPIPEAFMRLSRHRTMKISMDQAKGAFW